MTQEQTEDATARTRPGTRQGRTAKAHVVRWVFRLVMAVLIVMLAVRTYEETAVAYARSHGTLRTAEATVTKLTSHTTRGRDGGGQDGGSGDIVITTTYTIELRVGDRTKTLTDVPDQSAYRLREGQRVEASLWRGRVVEIDGRDVWLGWHPSWWDGTLYATYPLIMGYVIALAVNAAGYLAGLRGRVRLAQEHRIGPLGCGLVAGTAAILVLLATAALGHPLVFWPLIPVGAGTVAALVALRGKLRWARILSAADTPGGTAL